jgi:hypothetical protein
MDYLTNYYKNLSEQLQEKVNHLEAILSEASGFPGDKVKKTVSRSEQEAINADYLKRTNVKRASEGLEPFASVDDLFAHNRAESDKRRAQIEAEQKARTETWMQTPEGKANIARGMAGSAESHDTNTTDNVPVYRRSNA